MRLQWAEESVDTENATFLCKLRFEEVLQRREGGDNSMI